jgi:hypothetical protein
MNFLNKDFEHLTQKDEDYRENFESSANFCQRVTALYHTLQYLLHVRRQLGELPP